jgi:hypothetical protein
VTAVSGVAQRLDLVLPRVIDTPGVMCGDFHMHTMAQQRLGATTLRGRSLSAIADGLEHAGAQRARVRRADFERRDRRSRRSVRGLRGLSSIELTSFEVWGHLGVFPLTPDPTKRERRRTGRGRPIPSADGPRRAADHVPHAAWRCSTRCERGPRSRS